MARDDEKLLRQLSLLTFLLTRSRPAARREIQLSVEGYALMTADAFTRRFFGDREDLEQAGIVIEKIDDEAHDHGEAYYLPAENFYLPDLELTAGELAALSAILTPLGTSFAYVRPLRLALASLTDGRPLPRGSDVVDPPLVLAPDVEAREKGVVLARIDAAIRQGKTIRFAYRSASQATTSRRTLDPYGLFFLGGHWYVVGRDHTRDAERMFRVSRISGRVTYASKKPRDFTIPLSFDPDRYRARPAWLLGAEQGRAEIRVQEHLAWWIERIHPGAGPAEQVEGGRVDFVLPYADGSALVLWLIGLGAQAELMGPQNLREELRERLSAIRDLHSSPSPESAADSRQMTRPAPGKPGQSGDSGSQLSVSADRLSRLLALLRYLLEDGRQDLVEISAIEKELGLGRAELEEDLALLNLVNFGGGTYLVYAEIVGDCVEITREVMSDVLARPARLSPALAKALLLALDLVGDKMTVDGGTSLASARVKLEKLVANLAATGALAAGDLTPVGPEIGERLSQAVAEHTVVELDYYSPSRERVTRRQVEPYLLYYAGTAWYLEAFCLTAGGQRTFRLDRIKTVRPTENRFAPRGEIDLAGPAAGRLHLEEPDARWSWVCFAESRLAELQERGVTVVLLEDERIGARIPYVDERWLIKEILRYGGEAELLEPGALRPAAAAAAAMLLSRYE